MDSCYKHRGKDNWWCLLARWLHSVFPPWLLLPGRWLGWASPLCHILHPLLSLQSRQIATADQLWPWGSMPLCCSAVVCFKSQPVLLIRSECCPTSCPHSFMNTGWTGGRFGTSQNEKKLLTCGWIQQKTTWNILYIRDSSDKEQANPFNAGQIA